MGLNDYKRHGASIYKTGQWKRLRFMAKRRDGFKCVQCGARRDLEVDHVKPIRSHPELTFDLGNLQTLCTACHSRKTREEVNLGGERDPRREAWVQLVRSTRRNLSSNGETDA